MIEEKRVGEELLLYDTERDYVHVLNTTAEIIYRLYQENKSIERIEEELRETFKLEKETGLREDIAACLDELRAKGIIS